VRTLRRLARLQRGAGFPHADQGEGQGDLPFFKVGDLARPGNERRLTICENWVSSQTARRLSAVTVPAGSVLLPKIGAALLGNARRLTTRPSVFDNNVLAVVPVDIDSEYLYYWLSTVDAGRIANPGPVPSLDDSALLDERVPCDDRPLQRAIADYLDRETARIDALISAKVQMAYILTERWQSVMQLAASGRLLALPSPRRTTSIPWLSDIPGHWREGLLKLVARLGSGHTPSRSHPEWWVDPTIPWITTGEVAQMRSDDIEYVTETRERISELGMTNSSATLHAAGTVVLCRTASAGYSAIMGADMATSQDFAAWACGPVLRPRFLLICLRAMRRDLLERLAMGSTHKTIYMPDIESIKIPLPPVEEQDRLVEAAWGEHAPLEQAKRRLREQIKLLQERRQVLITAAITGQLDLPEAA
jgi:type I restriction enzyme S subunit